MQDKLSTEISYVHVAVGLPLNDPFTYRMAKYAVSKSLLGCRVLVPFKNKSILGYVVGVNVSDDGSLYQIKNVIERIDTAPVLDASMLKITKWISDYYLCSWGEAIENALPVYLKTNKKSITEIRTRSVKETENGIRQKSAEFDKNEKRQFSGEFSLTRYQSLAVSSITESLDQGLFARKLLHGVTGSGKTEVYVRAIKHALGLGKTAVCMFPEIALTQHLEHYFFSHFPDDVQVVHSRMTDRERFIVWRNAYEGKKRLIIGPRSAVFMPLKNLGLIIIDEEHENTYKQSDTPRYHTRDVACKRMQIENGVLVLGGATPSLETAHSAGMKQIELLNMPERISKRPMPEVQIVDMRTEIRGGGIALFSTALKQAIEDTVQKKGGVLLFLNRRGFSTYVTCVKCGEFMQCPHCNVSLTYHQSVKKLICHYCDTSVNPPERCPTCGNSALKYGGVGTQKIESMLARMIPFAKIERLDTDSVKKKGSQEKILDDFRKRKIDILIGTQMVTKGFDFPHVTLVGIINADTVLSIPDFRSCERTFQLLTQVAGRAGRGEEKGRVIIQTFAPNHYAVLKAREHDFVGFLKEELARRKELNYPPFSSIVNVIVRSKDEEKVRKFAQQVAGKLKPIAEKRKVELLGPAVLPFYLLRGYFRWHVMFKGQITKQFLFDLKDVISDLRRNRTCQIAVDVDPVNIL